MLSVSMNDEEVTNSSTSIGTTDLCGGRSDTFSGYTVDQAIEKLGFGPFQLVTLLICINMVCNSRRTDDPHSPLSSSQVSMVTLQ